MSELPLGWTSCTLPDVAEIGAGNPAPQADEDFADAGIPFVRVQDMGRLGSAWTISDTADHITAEAVVAHRLKRFPAGTVLFTKSGASTLLNQRAILAVEACVVSHIATARPLDAISPEWLFLGLRRIDFAHFAAATTLPSLRLSKTSDMRILVPPIREQSRIVEVVREAESLIDATERDLKSSRAKLAAYRAAVLRAACEGRLVAMSSVVRKMSVTDVAEKIVDCPHSTPKFGSGEWGVVDTTCITPGRLVRERIRTVDRATFDERNRRLVPRAGDVVFAREGTVGTAVALPTDPPVCLGQRVMLIRPATDTIDPKFLEISLMSPTTRAQYAPLLVGSTVPHVNVRDVIGFMLDVPAIEDQRSIVAEVERRLSVVERLEATIDANLARARRLRQAILKRAFEGRLVPQDPNDEPASVLLERIRRERAAQSKQPALKGRRAPRSKRAA